MDAITVLITGVGAPGTKGTLYSLEKNFERRKIKTVGIDIKKSVVGQYLCDKFYQISRPESNDFIVRLKDICIKEQVDVILPQVTAELQLLAANAAEFEQAGTHLALSTADSIKTANNKYELMKLASEIGVPTPKFALVNNSNELEKSVKALGYPDHPVAIKPPISHGMIGFRILDKTADKRKNFFTEKPDSTRMRFEDLDFLDGTFSELLVMEYLPGEEYSVDILSNEMKTLVVIPRRRETIRTGITFEGTAEKENTIVDYSTRLVERLGLRFVNGFQFKRDKDGIAKIIECNPRIQGTMVLSMLAGANIIYCSVKLALGEALPDLDIKWGTRLLRYWGGIGVYKEQVIDELI